MRNYTLKIQNIILNYIIMNTMNRVHRNIENHWFSPDFKEKLKKVVSIWWDEKEKEKLEVEVSGVNFIVRYHTKALNHSRTLYSTDNLPPLARHLTEEGLAALVSSDLALENLD